jgi:hypothetical protein
MQIEQMLVEGHPYSVIASTFSEVRYNVGRQSKLLPRIDWTSIRTHYRNRHMPVDAKAVREIAEQRLKELGKHVEELEERHVDSYMTARLVLAKGFDKIARGEMDPTVRETLAAAKMLEEFDIAHQESDTGDAGAWQEAMTIYFSEAQQLMPPAMWEEFARRLNANAQLRALAARQEGDGEEYVEAEVVTAEEQTGKE